VPQKEQLTWEKELLGVYVSAHPFGQFAAHAGRDTTALCGEISEELASQVVTLAGLVATAKPSITRDGNAFVTVELEDLNGRTEVVAWPRLYAQTKDFWQEGNVLLVEGKVVLRGDRSSIYADAVRLYQPGAGVDEVEVGQMVRVRPPGGTGHGRGGFPPKAAIAPRPVQKPTTVAKPDVGSNSVTPEEDKTKEKETPRDMSRRLSITMTQSDNTDADLKLFNRLLDLLAVYPGPESLTLQITCPDRVYHLRLPQVKVTCNDELMGEIETLLGAGSARCESNGH
jgi:DNA polymerase-3 subunit alpha